MSHITYYYCKMGWVCCLLIFKMMIQVIVFFSLVISTKEKNILKWPSTEISWKEPYKGRLTEHFTPSINPKNRSRVFSLINVLLKMHYVKHFTVKQHSWAFAFSWLGEPQMLISVFNIYINTVVVSDINLEHHWTETDRLKYFSWRAV